MRLHWATVIVVGTWLFVQLNCDDGRPQSSLKTQSNVSMIFYGKVVDQDGRPLEKVSFSFGVEAIPADWTFDTRGKPHNHTTLSVASDAQGRFDFRFTGHGLRLKEATLPGYRHFYNKYGQGDGGVFNLGYQITSWGDLWYRSDPRNPAVYVFVKDGVTEVSALPCRGGSQALGKQWMPNEPGWPSDPSLNDVVRKQPTTYGSNHK
jgi:hypothetical protein